ncbi:MAG: hypothetical protein WC496_03140 [Phycisphaerae bacterium]
MSNSSNRLRAPDNLISSAVMVVIAAGVSLAEVSVSVALETFTCINSSRDILNKLFVSDASAPKTSNEMAEIVSRVMATQKNNLEL